VNVRLRIMPNILNQRTPLPTIYPGEKWIIDQSTGLKPAPASSPNPKQSALFLSINMSNNTVRARLALSFKGETYELDSVIDLDGCSASRERRSDFHQLLARTAGIDPYSYLYEVLEAHEIEFSDATGVAGAKLPRWPLRAGRNSSRTGARSRTGNVSGRIAGKTMTAPRPGGDPDLKAALLAAYRAGKRGVG